MNGNTGVLSVIRQFIRNCRTHQSNFRRNLPAAGVGVGAALLVALLAFPAFGQVVDGFVGGMARDSATGKPVAEARIVAHNVDKGTDLFTTTDATGMYKFSSLAPGRYDVAATKDGFQKASTSVDVDGKHLTRLDLPLQADNSTKLSANAAAAKDSSAADVPADVSPTITKANTEPSTARERELLSRIDSLETRLAAMEAKEEGPSSAKPNESSEPTMASLNPPAPPETTPQQASTTVAAATVPSVSAAPAAKPQEAKGPTVPEALQAPEPGPKVDNDTPFAYADFGWLNGTSRAATPVFDTKFFTPEIRFDSYYAQSFHKPKDHTMGGSSEEFRSGEFQVEQASVGGDFHWQNVRGRVLTMFGMYGATTPRNDASPGVGSWDVRTAYRYVSEAYGGYHFNVNHGLNVDAGIFVSYIGLFSYYNYDNWTYQPSYVSSNTPWFFNGLRIQWFPTNKLKIEPWIINGWQSYNKFNSRLGLGGQILWRPTEWLSFVFNNYGMGTDTLNNAAVSRIHTDDSVEIKYYDHAENTGISKIGFSFTGDLGCEYGGGASCFTNTANGTKTSFLGWMAYNRFWFDKNKYAITVGGGQMTNPGRYLTLLPPINGADAISGSPYFTENFGDQAKMWDATLNFQWMPREYVTWWAEAGYRHSNVPYWSGHGGITPPGGANGSPADYACSNGASSGITSSGSITADLPAVEAVCSPLTGKSGPSSVWFPDLVRDETTVAAGILVRF